MNPCHWQCTCVAAGTYDDAMHHSPHLGHRHVFERVPASRQRVPFCLCTASAPQLAGLPIGRVHRGCTLADRAVPVLGLKLLPALSGPHHQGSNLTGPLATASSVMLPAVMLMPTLLPAF